MTPEQQAKAPRLALLLIVVTLAIGLFASGALENFSLEKTAQLIRDSGPWGIAVYVAAFALLQPLGLSGNMFAIVAGLACTLIGATPGGAEHDYRQTVSPWFRSIWVLQPRGDLMVDAPLWFHIHVLIGLTLFCLWPFTRLVHAFSAPIGYLFRPYIVYRSRDAARGPGADTRAVLAGAGLSPTEIDAALASGLVAERI